MSLERLIAWLATAIAHVFYRVDVIGAPPASGPLLLLPNHPNALLDPAIVIATAGRPVRFLAKSTLFGGGFGPLMRAAGAIPVYRKQDAIEMPRNAETFAAVDAALARGEAICLFPEGISHSSGMLEPLRTGAARMGLSAAAAGLSVRLVPVGINLERKTAFRSRVTIAYGPPLDVPLAERDPGDRDAAQALTARIAAHMRSVIVEAEPTRDAALVERLDRLYQSERDPVGREEALARRRAIADGLQRLRRERPDWYEEALVQLRRYDERLTRFGMEDAALDWNVSRAAASRFVVREVPAALVLLPVGLLTALVFALPYALTAGAARLSKEMDVTATTKVIGGTVLYAAWIALLSVAAWWLWGAAAAVGTAVLLPALAVAGWFAIERESAAWETARAWLAVRGAHPTTRQALKRRRAELAVVLEQVYEWMANAER
ncbi:MAG: lysophospholipid acyltransferase family protein [Vicinamibacterales bacterium]